MPAAKPLKEQITEQTKSRPDMESLKVLLILILSSRVASDCGILLNDLPPYLTKEEQTRTAVDSKSIRSGLLKKGVGELIHKYSKTCTDIKWIPNKTLNNTSSATVDEVMKRLQENKTILSFPIPVEAGEKLREYYMNDSTVQLIPIQRESNLIVLVDIGRCRDELSYEIFRIIWKQSPILPIMLLLAAIAGVILWVLEAPQNEKEFSSSFFRGTFDGFWWAFISMTTVGYGDKTPRTKLGRVFGMIWITMGIVIISFFTATIASTITIATVEKSCHTLKNRNVAIMSSDKSKLGDYVLQQGAKDIKAFDSFPEMFETWRDNQGKINSLFVEEDIVLTYFQVENQDYSRIKDIRVTMSNKELKSTSGKTLFYAVMKIPNPTGIPCGLDETSLKKFLSVANLNHFNKPPHMYKTSFEEEVDQPFSIGSKETIPILIYLSICYAVLAVSGYIGITIINYVKKIKKKPQKFEEVEGQEMENTSSFSKRRMFQLQQSLNLIAQEIKEMKDVLDSNSIDA